MDWAANFTTNLYVPFPLLNESIKQNIEQYHWKTYSLPECIYSYLTSEHEIGNCSLI